MDASGVDDQHRSYIYDAHGTCPIIKRKAVNLSLDEDLVRAAREQGVNISRASEAGLREAVREETARRWEAENQAAIEGWNRWTAEHGLPLARYRQF